MLLRILPVLDRPDSCARS